MGKRIRDISEVSTPLINIKESLSVCLKKPIILVSMLLICGLLVFFGHAFIVAKKYLMALLVLLTISFNLREKIKYYMMAFDTFPYLLINKEGISYEKNSYSWHKISSIKFEKYLAINWVTIIHLYLVNNRKIIINLPAQFLDQDYETIIAYLKEYREIPNSE